MTKPVSNRNQRLTGGNQLAFVALGRCPSSWALRRYFGFRGAGER